jgi:hypothetical protein
MSRLLVTKKDILVPFFTLYNSVGDLKILSLSHFPSVFLCFDLPSHMKWPFPFFSLITTLQQQQNYVFGNKNINEKMSKLLSFKC